MNSPLHQNGLSAGATDRLGARLDVQAEACPTPDTRVPVATGAQDFVELSRWGCYGTCTNLYGANLRGRPCVVEWPNVRECARRTPRPNQGGGSPRSS